MMCLIVCLMKLWQYDLELVLAKNFHEFVHEYMQKPEFLELMRKLGALGDGNRNKSKSRFLFCMRTIIFSLFLAKINNINNPPNWYIFEGTLSADEWEAAYLYLSFVFRKVFWVSFHILQFLFVCAQTKFSLLICFFF